MQSRAAAPPAVPRVGEISMSDDPRELIDEAQRRKLLDAALSFSDLCRDVVSSTVAGGVEVSSKPDHSLVTNADLAAERAFRERVEQEFPGMGILGEEFGRARPESPYQWVIDPVDGTADFARGLPTWGSIIGLFYHGAPIVGVIDHPDLNLRLHAAHGLGAFKNGERISLEDFESAGTPRIGLPSRSNFMKTSDEGGVFDALASAYPDFRVLRTCLTHAYAATGQLDAALEWEVKFWDLAATRVIVEEAGGKYICVREREHPATGMLYCAVFGRPALVDRIVALLAAHV
jgi:fructose-1,6-bisphosphatase/inositol monophosphatase family enzyme